MRRENFEVGGEVQVFGFLVVVKSFSLHHEFDMQRHSHVRRSSVLHFEQHHKLLAEGVDNRRQIFRLRSCMGSDKFLETEGLPASRRRNDLAASGPGGRWSWQ